MAQIDNIGSIRIMQKIGLEFERFDIDKSCGRKIVVYSKHYRLISLRIRHKIGTMDLEQAVTLFRPVGQKEWELIQASGCKQFPPRLSFQPIFYPVLNEEYASQIARDWNTKDPQSGFVGYITRFKVKASFISKYPVKIVGGRQHQEYWIPAEELDEFNQNIVGTIDVIKEFRAPGNG